MPEQVLIPGDRVWQALPDPCLMLVALATMTCRLLLMAGQYLCYAALTLLKVCAFGGATG